MPTERVRQLAKDEPNWRTGLEPNGEPNRRTELPNRSSCFSTLEKEKTEGFVPPRPTAWETIPETAVINLENFSTDEERASWMTEEQLPAMLGKTVLALKEAVDQNASNLIMMHRELAYRWVMIAEDLDKISGQQAVIQTRKL